MTETKRKMLSFLSHSCADTEAARELKRRILAAPAARDAGLDVWLDVDHGLEAGGPLWQSQIEDALLQSDCVSVRAIKRSPIGDSR